MDFTFKGAITIEGGEPEMPLYVMLEAGGQEIGGFGVTATGRFDDRITASSVPDAVRILAYDNQGRGFVADDFHRVALGSSGNGSTSFQLETDIPWGLVDRWSDRAFTEATLQTVAASYRVQGRVVTRTADNAVVPVPNARVEIVEYDPQRKHWWAVPTTPGMFSISQSFAEHRDILGVVSTDANGNFDYSFKWYNFHIVWPGRLPSPGDPVPDIVVRVSQQSAGRTSQLAETEPRMSLDALTVLDDIEAPIDKVLTLPNPQPGSNVPGFQAIGLLPADRIQDGYATSQNGDLVDCRNAPFGGRLELYALIKDPQVTHYRLSYAAAGSTVFEEVSDGLRNYVFDATRRVWKGVVLGPAKVGGVDNLYRSIEGESGYLYDPKLKARWSTLPDPGKYTVRLEGYHLNPGSGSARPVSSAVYSLDLRIDNTRPTAKVLGVYKQGQTAPEPECGIIDLRADAKQPLRVRVQVKDAEGHLGRWSLHTTHGYGRYAGDEFRQGEDHRTRQSTGIAWTGPGETDVTLPGTSGTWKRCAYRFKLVAVGRSTDGRSGYLRSQETYAHLNTFIDA